MATGRESRGGFRSPSRSPSFVVIGLVIVSVVLGFNYWVLAKRNSILRREIERSVVRIKELELRKEDTMKKLDYMAEQVRQKELIESRANVQSGELSNLRAHVKTISDEMKICEDNLQQNKQATKTEVESLQDTNGRMLEKAKLELENCNKRLASLEEFSHVRKNDFRKEMAVVMTKVRDVLGDGAIMLLQRSDIHTAGIDPLDDRAANEWVEKFKSLKQGKELGFHEPRKPSRGQASREADRNERKAIPSQAGAPSTERNWKRSPSIYPQNNFSSNLNHVAAVYSNGNDTINHGRANIVQLLGSQSAPNVAPLPTVTSVALAGPLPPVTAVNDKAQVLDAKLQVKPAEGDVKLAVNNGQLVGQDNVPSLQIKPPNFPNSNLPEHGMVADKPAAIKEWDSATGKVDRDHAQQGVTSVREDANRPVMRHRDRANFQGVRAPLGNWEQPAVRRPGVDSEKQIRGGIHSHLAPPGEPGVDMHPPRGQGHVDAKNWRAEGHPKVADHDPGRRRMAVDEQVPFKEEVSIDGRAALGRS